MTESALLAQDLASREQAVRLQQPLPSFIIEAPAGAGKTELLTQRYLMLLQTVQHPEEVVAITFTNKAASEMRERILSSLQKAHDGVLPELAHKQITYDLALKALQQSQRLNWKLLDNPSRLRIYTIDALSAQLARQMPLMSRFGGQPEVLQEADRLYQQAASNTLALLDDAEHGQVVYTALKYFNNDSAQLGNLLAEMLAKRDQWLDFQGSKITIQQSEQALQQLIQQDLQQALAVLTEDIQRSLMPIAQFAASNVECTKAIALLLEWNTPLSADSRQLALWQALIELLMTSENQFRSTWNKNQGIPPGDAGKPLKQALEDITTELASHPQALPILTRVRSLPKPQFGEYGKAMIDSLNTLLKVAYAQLWLLFQQQGKVDFVEISQRAIAAFIDKNGLPSELAMRLDYQIQHLLVDEFQDTSPTQIRLIEMLTREWRQGDGRSLFLVGDPMQSIYRFRKANVGLFLRAQQKGIGNIALTPLRLYQNNRSEPKIVHWINDTFKHIFPEQDSIAEGAIKYRPFVERKPQSDSLGVHIHALLNAPENQTDNTQAPSSPVDASTDPEDNAADAAQDAPEDELEAALNSPERLREANQMIQIIQQTRQRNPQAKIAVLVRARGHLTVLVSQIRRYYPELKFQAVEIEELANRQVVQDLLSLCHALHHRADRVHWLAVLRAPWCGLKLATLAQLIGNDKHSLVLDLMQDSQRLANMEADERQRLEFVRDILLEALQQQGRMSTARWLRATWLMLNGPHCLWKQSDAVDVEAFFERIDAIEREGGFSISELTREVEKLYAQPDVTAPDTLQFMTIHKSKGLEFDTVILPGLDLKSGRDDAPLMLWEELVQTQMQDSVAQVVVAPLVPKSQANEENDRKIYQYLKQFEKQRAYYEDLRVLYVAATRAERSLHLLGAVKRNNKGESKPAAGTFLAMLWPIVQENFKAENLDQSLQQDHLQQANQSAIKDFIPRLIRLPELKLAQAFASQPSLALAESSKSITAAAAQQVQSLNHDPQSLAVADPVAEVVSGLGIDIGTLTHRYLQLIAEQGLSRWTSELLSTLQPAMRAWFSSQGHSSEVAQQAAHKVQSLLTSALNHAQIRWLLEPHPEAQCEYTLEQVQADGTVKRWVIDRTFVSDGLRWIIDYKTDSLMENQTSQQLAESYRPQLQNYAQLFAQQAQPIKLAVVLLSVPEMVFL